MVTLTQPSAGDTDWATEINDNWTDIEGEMNGARSVTTGGTGTTTQFTQGSVVFAGVSGVYSQDNSNFLWDNTNKRLGIGTASPGNEIHILASGSSTIKTESSGSWSGLIMKSGTSGNSYVWQPSNSDSVRIYVDGADRANFNSTDAVINEGGAAYDFRVEGDTDANLLMVDGSTDRVGIGVAAPTDLFQVGGTASTGRKFTVTSNGAGTFSLDDNSLQYPLVVRNAGNNAIGQGVGMSYVIGTSTSGAITSGRIATVAEADYSSAANQDAGMVFSTVNGGAIAERARINAAGAFAVGAAPTANMAAGDILANGGSVVLAEITTPIADTNYGKLYTKSDNLLYFQDGAGTEAEVIDDKKVDAKGDILAATGADAITRLGVGSNDQILTADSAESTGLKWATPAAGGTLVFLGSVTASSDATVEFVDGSGGIVFDSTYDQYVLDIVGLLPATDGTLPRMRITTDGGSTWKSGASDYTWGNMSTGSSSVQGSGGDSKVEMVHTSLPVGSASSEGFDASITMFDPASSSIEFRASQTNVYHDNGTSRVLTVSNGFYTSTTAVDGIQIYMSSGNITSGEFYLYGIKRS